MHCFIGILIIVVLLIIQDILICYSSSFLIVTELIFFFCLFFFIHLRCLDKYSCLYDRRRGFKRLYTLKGGVSNYLKTEGSVGWIGNLFVFDARLSLPPSSYNSEAESEQGRVQEVVSHVKAFARCYLCDSSVSELRHRNCANIDCNLLFL